MQRLDKEFSQDWEIARILLDTELKLAKKHELDSIYTIDDVYDFLELLDTKAFLDNERIKELESQKDQAPPTGKR